MNCKEISDKIFEAFNIEFRDISDERNRVARMHHFYRVFFAEFGVDLDNVLKIQICQNLSGDNEMIPYSNFKTCAKIVLPDVKVGLLDVIEPSIDFVWKFLKVALEHFEKCDAILAQIYALSDPVLQAGKKVKQLEYEIYTLDSSYDDLHVKINNEKLMNDEAKNKLIDARKKKKDRQDARLHEQLKQQELLGRKNVSQMKLQEKTAKLNCNKKALKECLNRPQHSDVNIKILEKELSDLREKSNGLEIRNSRKNELAELKRTFIDLLTTEDNIYQAILKFKELKKQALQEKEEIDSKKELKDFEKKISDIEKEQNNLIAANMKALEMLNKSLTTTKENSEATSSKIQQLKSSLKNILEIELKLKQITEKATSLRNSFIEQDKKLDECLEEIAKKSEERILMLHDAAEVVKKCF